jgi:hypothetical protein
VLLKICASACSERDRDAHLPGAPIHRERDDRVDPDNGEQNRHTAESSKGEHARIETNAERDDGRDGQRRVPANAAAAVPDVVTSGIEPQHECEDEVLRVGVRQLG